MNRHYWGVPQALRYQLRKVILLRRVGEAGLRRPQRLPPARIQSIQTRQGENGRRDSLILQLVCGRGRYRRLDNVLSRKGHQCRVDYLAGEKPKPVVNFLNRAGLTEFVYANR